MNPNRPVAISIVQYQEEIASGKMTVFDLLDKAKILGAGGVELRRESWPDYQNQLSAVRDRFAERGLFATYATFSTLFNSTPDAQKMLHHDLDTAKTLNSSLLRIFPGAIPATDSDPAWDAAISAIDYAASIGVVIALENFGKSPGGRLSEIIRILERLPLPALRTNIDIGNYTTHGEDVPTAIRAVGGRAVYAHLKDKAGTASDSTTYLGGGTLPMAEIMAALDALPQPIIYCFEFVSGGEADRRIEKSLTYLRTHQAERKS